MAGMLSVLAALARFARGVGGVGRPRERLVMRTGVRSCVAARRRVLVLARRAGRALAVSLPVPTRFVAARELVAALGAGLLVPAAFAALAREAFVTRRAAAFGRGGGLGCAQGADV